ncbi:methionine ABC transporter ATP-binding protein [Entomobacter blattae]|uniref:Cell division ATP-binding protein FtsE n=1 Tax=Entomobacter blattae TaxID=2762277 RepID=A0A7H1NUL6_9PROT|nr:ATP-binding cassette domain-containing protein [Entomobacter blattae]QNT79476.1 Methionine import ATP-binding protein MetN [Entomobacter blattae]
MDTLPYSHNPLGDKLAADGITLLEKDSFNDRISSSSLPTSVGLEVTPPELSTTSRTVNSDEIVVKFENVTRLYGKKTALDNISLSIPRGEIFGIIGHSGAGKTTLLRCLAGLERPDQGRILIEGQDFSQLSEKKLRSLRQRIGLVFQHFNLLSSKTVADNIALPLKIAGIPKKERSTRITELLELVGLDQHADFYPSQLSGGQKQRVGIARALAGKPALLLCDEATSALDPETTRSILELLQTINQKLNLTIVLITHEMSVIRNLARYVMVLNGGKIAEQGLVSNVFAHPREAITKAMLQEIRPQLPKTILQKLVSSLPPIPSTSPASAMEYAYYAILQVNMSGSLIRSPFIAELQSIHHLTPILLEGGISHIGNIPIGTLFLAFPAQEVEQAQKIIRTYPIDTLEMLGYVTFPY